MIGSSRRQRRGSASVAILLLLGAVLSFAPPASPLTPPGTDVPVTGNLDICHAANSATNPYQTNHPNVSSLGGGGQGDHTTHTGPIFDADIHNSGDDWGDIIPPYWVDSNGNGVQDPGEVFPGLNWTEEGQLVYENDCTFPPSSLTIVKQVTGAVPAGWSFGFDATNAGGDDLGSFSLTNAATSRTFSPLFPSTHTITETSLATDAEFTDVTCDSGTWAPSGQSVTVDVPIDTDVTCTFTNHFPDPGTITVVKEVTGVPPANWSFGFSGDLGAFNLTNTTDTFVSGDLDAGPYTITEGDPGDADLTGIDCGDADVDLAAPSVTVNLTEGQDVICTFTNDFAPASLTIEKMVTGAVPAAWSFGYTSTELGGFSLTDDATSTVFTNLSPGDYSVSEGDPGDAEFVSLDCDDPDEVINARTATVTLDFGENVTCTYTNHFPVPNSITIIKAVTGAAPDDWAFDFTSPDLGGFDLTDDDVDEQFLDLDGGVYTVTETAHPDADFVGIDCGDANVDIDGASVEITVDEDEDVVCTYTNHFEPASLTIEKDVTGAVPQTWSFGYSSTELGGFNLTDVSPSESFGDLVAGEYTVSEDTLGGATFVDVVCVDSDTGDDVDFTPDGTAVTVPLDFGDDVTCTYTNHFAPAMLTVVKEATGAVPDSWAFDFTGDLGPFELTDVSPTNVTGGLVAGDYAVTEAAHPDATLTGIDCGDADVTIAEPTVTAHLEFGDDVTCTFTNHFEPASIEIVKEVTGAVPDDWTFGFDGDLGDFDLTDGSPSSTFGDLVAGDYTIEELAHPDASLTGIDCGDATAEVDEPGVTVSVDFGDDVTCTFTNHFEPAHIEIVKEVTGPAPDQWSFDFTGDLGDFALDDGTNTFPSGDLVAGEYTVTEIENGADGASLVGIDCGDADATVDEPSVAVTVDFGETVTCTFTNHYPNINVIKEVTGNIPDTWSFGFGLFDGPDPLGAFDLSDTDPNELLSGLEPGDYTILEALPDDPNDGILTGVECTGVEFETAVDPPDGMAGVVAHVLGDTSGECTFTNHFPLPGSITVTKSVTGAPPAEWSFDFTSPELGDFDLDNEVMSETFEPLRIGEYTITESDHPDATLTDIDCGDAQADVSETSVTVDLPEQGMIVCTFTNHFEPARLTVVKDVTGAVPDTWAFGFTGDLGDFTLDDGQSSEMSGELTAGEYTVTEADHDDASLTNIECVDTDTEEPFDFTEAGQSASVPLDFGDDVTCTFTNHFEPAHIEIVKEVTGPAPDEWSFDFTGDLGDFTLETAADSSTSGDLVAGEYTITEIEDDSDGASLVGIDCGDADVIIAEPGVTVDVDFGEDVTCTFTNHYPNINVVKEVTGNVPDDWTFGFEFPDGNPTEFDLTNVDPAELLSGLEPGDYTILEHLPADPNDGILTGFGCDGVEFDAVVDKPVGMDGFVVHVAEDTEATCTFTNHFPLPGSITVTKQVTGAPPAEWSFGFTSPELGDFDLTNDDSFTSFVDLGLGEYSITEVDAELLSGIDCGDAEAVVTDEGTGVMLTMPEAGLIACTFTNHYDPGSVTIVKEVSGDVPDSWEVGFSGDLGDFSLTNDDASETFDNLVAGDYTITESDAGAAALADLDCGGASVSESGESVTITLALGDSVTCTFTNHFPEVVGQAVSRPAPLPKQELPRTGSSSAAAAAIGLGLLGLGAALVANSRRLSTPGGVHLR